MKSNAQYKQTEIGEIPEEWNVLAVEEFAEVIGGGTPSTKDSSYFGGDIPWITPKDLSTWTNKRISRGERSITEKGLNTSGLKLLPKNSVLLTSRAPVGYLAIADNAVATNQGFKSLIPKENADSDFVYYLLKSNVDKLKNNASGSTFQELSGGVLKKIKFALPELPEQQQIASILSSLDDKIELNRRMNKTLEEIGKALFKHWFVDFEFPNENGEPYKSSGGEMVESELGEIPRGWKVEPVGNYLTILDSKRIPLSSRERSKRQGEYRYYGATGVVDYVDDFLFDGVYLLLGEDGTVTVDDGYPYTQYVWGQFWVNNHAHVLLGEKQFSTEYLKLFFDSTIISSYVTGAVQPKLNQTNLRSIPIVVPEKDLALNFDEFILPLFAHIRKNEDEIQSLISARDSLLPRLMSGKIRVD